MSFSIASWHPYSNPHPESLYSNLNNESAGTSDAKVDSKLTDSKITDSKIDSIKDSDLVDKITNLKISKAKPVAPNIGSKFGLSIHPAEAVEDFL